MLPTDGVIMRDPDILGGTAVSRGTRVPFTHSSRFRRRNPRR
jgi:hypothetical protein